MATVIKKDAKGNAPKVDGKKKSAVPENESKEDKFKRLATRRVKLILKLVDGLGNLGNRNAYGYSDEQIEKIFGKIEGAVRDTRNKFSKAAEKKSFHIEL